MKEPTPNYGQNPVKQVTQVTVHVTVDMVNLQILQSGQLGFLSHIWSYKTPNGVIQKRKFN